MARRKLKLAFIQDDAARKASMKKRTQGILKKAFEICILCSIETFLVIFKPNVPEPIYFPPNYSDAVRILQRFEEISPMVQCKKMLDHEAYLRDRVAKTKDQVTKINKKNKVLEIKHITSLIELNHNLTDDERNTFIDWVRVIGIEIWKRLAISKPETPLPVFVDPASRVNYGGGFLQNHMYHMNMLLNNAMHHDHGASSSSSSMMAGRGYSSYFPNIPNRVVTDAMGLGPLDHNGPMNGGCSCSSEEAGSAEMELGHDTAGPGPCLDVAKTFPNA